MVRWSWWLAIVWFNTWKQQVRSLAYLRNDGAKVILSWGGKKTSVNRASRCLSDEICHTINVPPLSTPGETVQQLGGHPKCILTHCWARTRFNCPLWIVGVTAKTILHIRRVVANYCDFADLTFLNAAWSAGWSTTDQKMKWNTEVCYSQVQEEAQWALKGGPGKVATEQQDPGHKALLKSEVAGLWGSYCKDRWVNSDKRVKLWKAPRGLI